jgi:RPE1 domain-containing protein
MSAQVTEVKLTKTFDLKEVNNLLSSLPSKEINTNVLINASEVIKVSTVGIQFLISLAKTLNKSGNNLIIKPCSEELKQALLDLGLDNRPLSKLASEEEFEGESTRRTGVYKEVHEDSRIDSTYKLPSEVELGKRSDNQFKLWEM